MLINWFLIAAVAVLLLNIPLGYWRAGVKKFSLAWFVAIHAVVPVVVWMRHAFELGYAWYTYAVFVPLYFLGQWIGIRLRKRRNLYE